MSSPSPVEIMPLNTHTHARTVFLWPIMSLWWQPQLQSFTEAETACSVPHPMRNCSHTHTAYIKSSRACSSNVEAMNLQLLYLHVPLQVAVALGNVNLARMDMIKERKLKLKVEGE